jgi:hypothetical protein
MIGSIRRRYARSWSLIFDLGYQRDVTTGVRTPADERPD